MPEPTPPDLDAFIEALRDASPYIHAFQGHTMVIAFPGETLESPRLHTLIQDLLLLHSLGIRLVLVHGARPQIAHVLAERGIAMHYEHGERITDQNAMNGVKEANGRLRVEIEALLSMGISNSPLTGKLPRITSGNFVTARPLGVVDGIDYLQTGRVRKVDAAGMADCLDNGAIVLLSALGYSPTGEVFNLRASEVAAHTASALHADKLIFLSDIPVPFPRQIHWQAAADQLTRETGLPDEHRQILAMAVDCCRQGVRRAHIIDWHIDGGLLAELFTRDGIGTLISGDDYEGIRPARLDDIGGLLELIRPLEDSGVLLPRSHESIELDIDHYIVSERDGMVIACAAVYRYGDDAELACLAVHPRYQGLKLGDRLLERCLDWARRHHCQRLFVLTTQAMHWFIERGFEPAERNEIPEQRRLRSDPRRGAKALIRKVAPS